MSVQSEIRYNFDFDSFVRGGNGNKVHDERARESKVQ